MVCIQAEIINKDIIANPITNEGPEAAAKKTLAAAAQNQDPSYASQVLANVAFI